MERGGRGALKAFRKPLAEEGDIETGNEFAKPNPGGVVQGRDVRSTLFTRNPRRGGSPQRSPAELGRRAQALGERHRRGTTPLRSSTEARSALHRSLSADGVVNAMCVAGALDLERLMESIGIPRTNGEGCNLDATPSASSSAPPPQTTSETPDIEIIRTFGTGEGLVLQLKLCKIKDVFVFRFGCMVCWSFHRKELTVIAERLRPFLIQELQSKDIEEDKMEFANRRKDNGHDDEEGEGEEEEGEGDDPESVGASAIRHDQIILSTSSPFERLAHSYALAQSVRLGVFEISVDRSIENTRSIPETMATTGEVRLDACELSKQMGGLLVLRCDVNLHTDILDTPEIFWDEERFEPHYVACRSYLDIDKRVEILNQRLGVLKDLYDLLQNSLNVKHGNKLEWIIIILILVEVLLELLELLHDAWVR